MLKNRVGVVTKISILICGIFILIWRIIVALALPHWYQMATFA